MRKLVATLFKYRMKLIGLLESIPFWPQIVRLSTWICSPVVRFANATLQTIPSLRKAEWLLEIELLTRRHPVLMAFSMTYLCWRGLHTTSMGHIGTDRIVYPFLAAISGFNPFLGIVCGVTFGLGDLIQKLLVPDIFGAEGWDDANYWGAIAGYMLAYSSVIWMGFFPGATSRVARLGMRKLMQQLVARHVAASAAGSGPSDKLPFPEYYNPQSQTYNLEFKDPRILEIVKQLRDDPRKLMDNRDAWRNLPLTPEQKVVMAQLRDRGLLGAENADKLQKFLDDAAGIAGQTGESALPPHLRGHVPFPPPGMSTTELVTEQLVAGFGAFLAASASMHFLNGKLEWPAFEAFRPDPDVSCRKLEETLLAQQGTTTGLGAALGTLAPMISGVGGPGPGSGGPGGGSKAPTPSIESLLQRWHQVNLNNVSGNESINSQLNAILNEYNKTGRFNVNALSSVEQQLQQIDNQNAIEFQRKNEESLARSYQQMKEPSIEELKKQQLVDDYNNLVKSIIDGNLTSAAGLGSIDDWHKKVVDPNGYINEEELKKFKAAAKALKINQLQQQVNLSSTAAGAFQWKGWWAGGATTAAQFVRNTAFAVEGALLTGGIGAAAGGGWAGLGAATTAGTAYGGLAGGVTAMSQAGTIDAGVFASGAKTGMVMGGVGSLLGLGAGMAGLNPYLAGALIGGGMPAATGGNVVEIVEGAVLGVAGLHAGNWAGGLVATGGWRTPVWSGSGTPPPGVPIPGPTGPRPPRAVNSPRWGSPQSQPWGRMPVKPAPASMPPGSIGPTPYTSSRTGDWGIGKPPKPGSVPQTSQSAGPAGPTPYTSPKTGDWGIGKPPKPGTMTQTSDPSGSGGPTPYTSSRTGDWGIGKPPKLGSVTQTSDPTGPAGPEPGASVETGDGAIGKQPTSSSTSSQSGKSGSGTVEEPGVNFIEEPSAQQPSAQNPPAKKPASGGKGTSGGSDNENIVSTKEALDDPDSPSSSTSKPGDGTADPEGKGTSSKATADDGSQAGEGSQSGKKGTQGKTTSDDASIIDNLAKDNSIEQLRRQENFMRKAGDTETADLIAKAIQKKLDAGEPDVPVPPEPMRPDPNESTAGPHVEAESGPATSQPRSSIDPNDLPPPGPKPTWEQKDNLQKYSIDELLAARAKALSSGDIEKASFFENALAEKGYRAPVDPNDLPPDGTLAEWSQVEAMAKKYSYDQLWELKLAAEARGDLNVTKNIWIATQIKFKQDPWGYHQWEARNSHLNTPPDIKQPSVSPAAKDPPLAEGFIEDPSAAGPSVKEPTLNVRGKTTDPNATGKVGKTDVNQQTLNVRGKTTDPDATGKVEKVVAPEGGESGGKVDPQSAPPPDAPEPKTPPGTPKPDTPVDGPEPKTPPGTPKPDTPPDPSEPKTPPGTPKPDTPVDGPEPTTPQPLTAEQRSQLVRDIDDLRGRQVATDQGSSEWMELQKQIDQKQAQIDQGTTELSAKDGYEHGGGTSAEATARNARLESTLVDKNGNRIPQPGVDNADVQPGFGQAVVESGTDGKIVDVNFGAGWNDGQKAQFYQDHWNDLSPAKQQGIQSWIDNINKRGLNLE